MDNRLHLDFETKSETNLLTEGTHRYVKCPSTEVLMLGYAFGMNEPELWLPYEQPLPERLKDALYDPEYIKVAHNSTFELQVFEHVMGMPQRIDQWQDTMIMAHYCSFPGALDRVGKIIKLGPEYQKDEEGKRLIKLFCEPQKITKKNPHIWRDRHTDPEDWEKFCRYCIRDVVSERAIDRRLSKYQPPEHEWHYWRLDYLINQRGYPIDVEFADKASDAFKRVKALTVKKLNAVTKLKNSKSPAQMKPWAEERGYTMPDMQKGSVKRYMKSDEAKPIVKELLTQYQSAMSNSPAKFAAIRRVVSDDERARNSLQFMGAQRTHRDAGRVVQFQNVSHPDKRYEKREVIAEIREAIKNYQPDMLWMLFDDPMAAIVSSIRSVVTAPAGRKLAVADLSAIENVMLGWLAECPVTMEEVRTGKDPYLAFGSYMVGRPYEDLHAEYLAGDKTIRTLSKPAKLGAGYRLGPGEEKKNGEKTGLWGYAESMGIEMSQADCIRSIEVYRETYTEIVQLWYDMENAAKRVIRGHADFVDVKSMRIDTKGPFMRIRMPSGTHLHYCRPRIEDRKTPWGEIRPTITYEGVDQLTKKWTRLQSHGGKIVENVTQKAARDVLFNGIDMSDRAGLAVFGHVHDEIKAECDIDCEETLPKLIQCMTTPPWWAPDLPLKAEGYYNDFYMKD